MARYDFQNTQEKIVQLYFSSDQLILLGEGERGFTEKKYLCFIIYILFIWQGNGGAGILYISYHIVLFKHSIPNLENVFLTLPTYATVA